MVKISGFIIAKNEEKHISRALGSLQGICDEIVLVDTGSTDKTKEIAQKVTDKIYDFEWIDDFSAARNFALNKCTGDWVVFIDADDEIMLNDQRKVVDLIQNADKETLGFFVNYLYSRTKFQLTPRIFRNDQGFEFRMPIHEYLDVPKEQFKKFKVKRDVFIIHHKKFEDMDSTLERNIRILKANIEKDPNNAHLQFFLGRELYNKGDLDGAIDVFNKVLTDIRPEDKSFLYNLHMHIGRAYQRSKRINDAIRHFDMARAYDTRFAEPLVYKADILLYDKKDPKAAKVLYEEALSVPKPDTNFPLVHAFYHQYPKDQLEKIARLDKPIALVCGYYGLLNFGDEMILASIIQNLPEYRVIVVSYNPKVTSGLHKIESVPHRSEQFNEILPKANMLIIGGGGLFHDQGLEENKNVEYYCGLIDLASEVGTKVHLLGVGVDALKLPKNVDMISRVLPKCSTIHVRDENSKNHLVSYGVDSGLVDVAPDLAFGLDLPDFSGFADRSGDVKPLVAFNVCPAVKNSPVNLMRVVDEKLVPFVKNNWNTYDFRFVPAFKSDLPYVKYFKEKADVDLPVFRPEVKNLISAYLRVFSTADYIIGTRFHVAILGLILKKPTYVLSYSEKTDSLLSSFSQYLAPFDGKLHDMGHISDDELSMLARGVREAFDSVKNS